MGINSIQGMQNLNLDKLSHIGKIGETENTEDVKGASSFKSIFTDAIDDYKEAENMVDNDIKALATGNTDDLHNLMINTQKAELSLELVLQIRNKALEAYNEMMRINV